jgi:hypothetical protein
MKTAAYYGVKLKSKLEKCYECSMTKIKQSIDCKESKVKSNEPGARLYIDITSVSIKLWGQ